MANPSVKIVKVLANGKRYLFLSEDKGKVRCKGVVLGYAGASATHGTDKTFLSNRVEVSECDYSEELLMELYDQDKTNV